jgi:two-component system chemotaxis response regulator CheB
MPKEAIRRGAAKFVHPLDRIAPAVMAWVAGVDTGSRQ